MHLKKTAFAVLALLCSQAAVAENAAVEPAADAPTEAPAEAPAETSTETSTETSADAASDTSRYGGLGLRFGTAGFGIDYTYGINRFLDVRAGYHFGSYSDTFDEDGIDYDGELKISGASLMLDVKPFAGGFRISAGLFTGTPEFELKASGRNEYEIGDTTYDGNLRLDGGIDLGSTAPYLGIGWGGTTNGTGFGVSFDLGVMFTGSPDVSMVASGLACEVGGNPACDPTDENSPGVINASADPTFQAELDKEIANIEDDAKDFKVWPVLMFGLHYRF